MTRRCQHCDGWHFDFNCPKRPKSFSIHTAVNQWPDPDTEDDETPTTSASDNDSSSDSSDSAPSYSNVPVYSNGRRTLKSFSQMVLPQAEKFAVQEVPASETVGTGVSYLSAEPCPVKAWVGTKPHSNAPLSSGVADSGGPSIIQQDLVPQQHKILPSPCNPKFQGIGNNTTDVQGYVVLPMYLPNAAAISGDASEARVLCLPVEFQVVEQVAAGFLIGRDALKAYKAIIDEELGQIVFPTYSPPFHVPITETSREEAQEMDARVFAAESVSVRPRSESLVPIRLGRNLKKIGSDMLISPVHKLTSVSGIHASCSYSIISPDTTHVLYVNPSNRPVRILSGQVLATAEPVKPNTPCCYFSDVMSFSESAAVPAVAVAPELAFPQGGDVAAANTAATERDFVEIIPAFPVTVSDAPNLQTIQDTL